MGGENPRHLRIKIDQSYIFHLWIPQDLPYGQAIAAAEHEYPPGCRNCRQTRVYQGFMITVFVARAELEVRVQEEANIVFPFGQDNVLVMSVAREDDLVGVDIFFCKSSDSL